MEKLRRIYLCTHALAWSKHGDGLLEMDDIERHEKLDMAEDWPGRIVVDVEFPAETVVECDVMGYPLCRARGLVEYPYRYFHGPMTMRARHRCPHLAVLDYRYGSSRVFARGFPRRAAGRQGL